ncbi:hypothetical protein [Asticcacaulis sp. AND118]|uniref:hypothetical protein n=1 Tax=Asticcacaulis sp. AND118 TaxID=2840468 RepID=UPI001CFFE3E9|nr:hypothetical protein [Asticcacaulis sp. AND118]UDF03497.1 hypothetical protein LH365_00205 [Asticcacaulis sp. AND118]
MTGYVNNESELIAALQARIIALERLNSTLLPLFCIFMGEIGNVNAMGIAKLIEDSVVKRAQGENFEVTEEIDSLWQAANDVTRHHLDQLLSHSALSQRG